MWTNKDGSKVQSNVWVKRLGLFLIIVAMYSEWFKSHPRTFWLSLFCIIGLIIVSTILKGMWRLIKSLF